MPKPKPKPLTPLIEQIWNLSGDKDALAYSLRPHIQTLRDMAEKLESDLLSLSTTPKKKQFEAEIAKLQGVLKSQANDFQSQISQLHSVIKKQQEEIKSFRAERKKQEEEERRKDLPDIQFQILERLGTEHSGNWPRIDEIARNLKIPLDEAEIHFEELSNRGFAISLYNEPGGILWRRTPEGNKLVVAKRWAGEEQTPRKFADLPTIEEDILVVVLGHSQGILEGEICYQIKRPLEIVKVILSILNGKGFVSYDLEEATWGLGGHTWFITNLGRQYLAERGKL